MNTEEYNAFVKSRWTAPIYQPPESTDPILANKHAELNNLFIMATGFAGETGEVVEHLKKYVRDGVLDRRKFILELGDQHFYFTKILDHFGITLEEVRAANKDKLDTRFVSTRKFS